MINLLDLLAVASHHLQALGITSEGYLYEPTPIERIEAFEREFSLTLPQDFVVLYSMESDGCTFHWEAGDVQGGLCLPELDELRLQRQRWCTDQLDCEGYQGITVDDTVYPERFPWVPLIEEGNGDLVCLDAGTGRIAIWCHDEFKFVTLGSSIGTFLENWSKVCFQSPKGLYWPRGVDAHGVDWHSDEFDDCFRIT